MNKIYQMTAFCQRRSKFLFLLILLSAVNKITVAQCPPNIDFEQGSFAGWKCYSGTFNGTVNWIPPTIPPTPIPPNPGRHDLITAATVPTRDQWGNFPKLCPNGSGYSVRIGAETGGTNADGVTYTFTIPAGQNTFSLIYNYAIVINNTGGHPANIQPRLTVSVKNLTDNTTDACSSFDIAYSNANPLLGFQDAPSNPNIKFKPWAANSINLDNNAGKTIEISFTATGCGANGGTHFGYAYIDLNTECGSSFVGATFCRDDAFINVTAPFGYLTYEWFADAALTIPIGNTQTINFTPPPPAGTIIYVRMNPIPGYGCTNVLAAELLDTLTVQSVAGPDGLSCQNAPVQLGGPPRATYVYSWSPVTGLSDPNISNPIATPSVTTQYVVTTTTAGGGCATTDTVIVKAAVLDNSIVQTGLTTYCAGDPQAAVLKVNPADSIQWYQNNVAIPGATQTQYIPTQTGTYHATVFSFVGCDLTTTDVIITINPQPLVGFITSTPADQCFNGNQFIFTDTSSISFGTLNYTWDLGDGTLPAPTTPGVTHSYLLPGTYVLKQLVTSDKGCSDSTFFTVHVFDSPVAGFFTPSAKEQCFKNNRFDFTNTSTLAVGNMQYNWDFGDMSAVETTRDATHSYAQPGTYTVHLTVTSDKNCPNDSAFNVTVNPNPANTGFSIANPQQCFTNNQFNFINNTTISSGSLLYQWNLGDGATDPNRDVTHSYAQTGDYIVKMVATSDKGCTDSSTTNVRVFKYVSPDFYVEPACVNLRLPITNKTINSSGYPLNYLWDFGNGSTSTAINPVYSYPADGNYQLSLSVNTAQCPLTVITKTVNIRIDEPAAAVRYPDREVVMNYPEKLNARSIGNSVVWFPATSLDYPGSYQPTFKGLDPQLYTITLKTQTGCVTVDTQYVKTRRKIDIYVPTTFTPNGDGLNDYLYPNLLSFKKVNYFRVYNRWGKLLFQMQSDRPGWDGKVNGQVQEVQTVIWMVEAVDVDGNVQKKQGTTILLR